MKQSVGCVALIGLWCSFAAAQTVNFDAPGGLGAVNYHGQGALIDSGHDYWNPIKQNATTAAATNSDGTTVSTITLTDQSPGSYNPGQGTQGTPAGLESPFLLANNNSAATETLNHVPAGTYNLYLYGKNDDVGDADRGATFTVSVNGTSYGTQSTVNSVTSAFTQGNDYVKFSNLVVGAEGVITFTYTANTAANSHHNPQTEGDFNGLQLIPSSADTNTPPPTGWRVVIPTLNTNEIVVTETTPQDYGAVGDGITDDSAAFQAAINAVYHSGGSGGGVVYIPAGNYAFYSNLNVPTGVTLHGDWMDWTKGTNGCVGTTFKVYYGAGQSNATPFIYLNGSAALKGVNIWYPNQNPDNIAPYPFTIGLANDTVVQNVVLVNSYQGIQVSANNGGAKWILSTVIGTPLYTGLTVDGIADICHSEDVRFSPDVWANSKLTNAPTAGSAYATWMRNNGTAMLLYRVDGLINMNTAISGYKNGIDMEISASGPPGASFYNGYVSNCATAFLAQEMQTAQGQEFSLFTLDGDIAINRTHTTNEAAALFDDCNIIGRSGVAVHSTGASWRSTMAFQNCSITGTLQLDAGVFNLVNCSLNADTQCVMSATATRAAFTGCDFSPAQQIVNHGNAGNLIVDGRRAISNAMPMVEWTNIVNDYVSRRPAKTDLFVATDYGAVGDGSTDNTTAIQNALTAAGNNGGGIVYVPAGKYKLTSTLNVPSGVELRGAYELRHRTWPAADNHAKGTILQPSGGQGTTNGPPAIVLNANAGIVGMTITYETQNSNCIAFPPTIQGRGGNVYAIGVQCPDPYWYVDLDTYTCTNHFLYMVDGWALKYGCKIGNGSSGSIVDCQANWTYWIDNYDGNHIQGAGGDMVDSFAMHHLEYYVLGDCTELFIKDFSILQNIFLHTIAENGRGPNFTGISATCDVAYDGFVFDSAAASTFNDLNPLWAVALGGGYSDLTNATLILTTTNYQGTAHFFNLPLWGSPVHDFVINGGDVSVELTHLWQHASQGSQVNSGVFHLVNSGAYDAVNGPDGPYKITFGANAGSAGKTNELIGCYAYNGYSFTNLNSGNPVNVWVDYALSSYDMLGGPPNLALNRPVTVSSVADNSPGPNAVDGNLGTRWSSAYSDPQWIYVDLGTNYNINTIELVWENAYGKAYQIQVSTNAVNWTTIFNTNNAAGGTDYLTGLSGQGRYVRMYGLQRGTMYGYSLWEFEVFGDPIQSSNVTPPLSIQTSPDSRELTLQWPDDGSGTLISQPSLYYTPDLTSSATWVLITNTPTLSNGQWSITLPYGTNEHGFYKLQNN
ncbi:MAG TPA: glycosyl hydrolase family 28-related protein [Verrucomicrobiae bacterium]|nr:glycosyl hydrolase family 28-related protein [Verrucomicrobiae bacterium]